MSVLAPAIKENAEELAKKSISLSNNDLSSIKGNDEPNNNDLSAYLIEKTHNEEEQEQIKERPITGIKKLDEKIKNNNLSAMDYLVARKYLGIDLNMTLNGNLNIKSDSVVKNQTQALKEAFEISKNLDLANQMVNRVQEGSGLYQGLRRFLDDKTNGFVGLNHEQTQTKNLATDYIYSFARAMNGGRATNANVEDAKKALGLGARSKEQNTSNISQSMRTAIDLLDNKIENLRSAGANNNALMYLLMKRNLAEQRADYIDKNQGKINLKDYNQITSRYERFMKGE
ncbi:hypothetical protein [Helicobacter cetorum]|uniref:Coiled-coil domain-containing protein n=1 Tax=Helicobacter cetorum (strain ATCC BAA-429 / MIT 00-7128) TaxID=182217 RepID=I0ELP1_HELC0|nr:hypothetical protein [Helicobacter cetorum]AFI03860.1 hypothetical protein HCW_02895 [Helicobacter cetorum MIT 00-7128]